MRAVIVLASMIVLVGLGSITPPVFAAPSCDVVGTVGRDVVAGGTAGEVICLLDGNDYAHGNGGRDRLRGGPGRDSLVGGAGRDRLKGGPGEDRLFATDQKPGNDILRGGAGFDHCHADPGDIVRGCEQIHRGNVAATTEALTDNSLAVTEIAEEALEPVPGGVPTQPPGAVFPPCTPPPPPGTSPAPCPGE